MGGNPDRTGSTVITGVGSAERDIGRMEGKMDILLATMTRMDQRSEVASEMVAQRFQKIEARITHEAKVCSDARQKIDDKVSTLRTRIAVVGVAVLAAGAASVGNVKVVIQALLHFVL